MKGRVATGDATAVVSDVAEGVVPQRIAGQVRRGKAVWLRAATHDALQERSERAGVSMSAFVENAIVRLRTPLPTAARIAAPLASVGYRLAQIADALDSGNVDSARADLAAARRIIVEALRPLVREHASEARDVARHGDDWSG